MAYIADVSNALVNLAAGTLYPNGTAQPSISGSDIIVYRGWPNPDTLDADLAQGKSHVSFFEPPGMGSNTTRFPQIMQVQEEIPAAQLSMTVAANQITIGGIINVGEAATAIVNYKFYGYTIQAGDTLASVAASLAAKIPNATASGNVITITEVFDIEVKVSVPVAMQEEVGRVTQAVVMTVWTPTPALRDTIGKALDTFFRLPAQKRILLADNTLARLICQAPFNTDELGKAGLYRMDLRMSIEYANTATEIDNTVAAAGAAITPACGVTTSIIT